MKYIKKLELKARRIKLAEKSTPYSAIFTSSSIVADVARSILLDEDQEVFLVFITDVRNRVLGYVEVARGGIDLCPVDTRAVFRTAIHMGASGLILVHNHPSGSTVPSSDDIELTTKLVEAGYILGIAVLDHLIIAEDRHSSLAELGMMRSALPSFDSLKE